jgi:hypothetical protein
MLTVTNVTIRYMMRLWYYSIVLNACRVTSMADTGIDDVKKQRNAKHAKQYRMKRKLLMQQQASTSSEPQLAEKHVLLLHISFLRILVVLYLRVTCICVA